MKLHYEKRTIFAAIYLLSIGLILASVYFYRMMPQLRGMRETYTISLKMEQ